MQQKRTKDFLNRIFKIYPFVILILFINIYECIRICFENKAVVKFSSSLSLSLLQVILSSIHPGMQPGGNKSGYHPRNRAIIRFEIRASDTSLMAPDGITGIYVEQGEGSDIEPTASHRSSIIVSLSN